VSIYNKTSPSTRQWGKHNTQKMGWLRLDMFLEVILLHRHKTRIPGYLLSSRKGSFSGASCASEGTEWRRKQHGCTIVIVYTFNRFNILRYSTRFDQLLL